ncbi:lytic transglycosylase domain-containing protein [Streptomyces sp. NPDC001941]|uniref:lytic transglycosylase domain-containing protein n=1 Tax=Streptomyces sp. NPDC001941 TaxID=3154659 RepID=UPI003333F8CB
MAAQFGRRLRRGATTATVAAAAVAALSASQAPGATPPIPGAAGGSDQAASDSATPQPGSATGNSPYYTDLPPLNSPNKPDPTPAAPVVTGPAEAGIPATVLAAYQRAEATQRTNDPGCNLPWQLLAGIGKVESGQANGGAVSADGTTTTPILGPVLNGSGFANISDTDGGAYDGDTTHDRAVGPMQFIPSTWETWGRDANGDGRRDPNNIYDAAQAAAEYLCAGNRNLSVQSDVDRAILSYNHSGEYLRTVMQWFDYYRQGTHQVPDGSGVQPGGRSDNPVTLPTPTPVPTPTPKPPSPRPTPPPTKPPTPPTKPPTPKPTPAQQVDRLKDAGQKLTATAGGDFAGRAKAVALDAKGKPVAKVQVKFEIVGDTDSRFAGGATSATVTTGADGAASAPALKAGEKTGFFTVRASVVGKAAVPGLGVTATVSPRQADLLARTDSKALTAVANAEFADAVEVKATLKGAVASGVAATATFVTAAEAKADGAAGADAEPKANDKGPYFKDDKGNPVRTLDGLKTDANGLLKLPKIYADGETGTFLLRLTTTGGAVLTIELKVTAPAATPGPTSSPSASPSASGSPAA